MARGRAPAREKLAIARGVALPTGTRRRDNVVARIRQLILDLALKPGDRLPGERQLARDFGVSRGLIREATQFLATIGMLKVRHGGGSFLQVAPGEVGRLRTNWREWVTRNRGMILETIEVRLGAEAFAAELAARRAGPDDLEKMVRILQAMKAAGAADDIALFVQSDLDFHDAVLLAAGNNTLREFLSALGAELIPERMAVIDLEGRSERSLAEHFAIYEAIQRGDSRGAAEAMRRHLESVRADILEYVINLGTREASVVSVAEPHAE